MGALFRDTLARFRGQILGWGIALVLVGLMVGVAVRNASRGRGGLAYQALAIFLTYSAIAASFGAEFMVEMSKDARAKRAAAKPSGARPA